MKDMSKFQLILTGVFAACLVAGVIAFATFRNTGGLSNVPLTVWGTMRPDAITAALEYAGIKDNSAKITYVKKDPETFDDEFINAYAEGAAPDVILISQAEIFKYQSKIFPIPYQNYDERAFKDTFVQEGELFLSPSGIVAIPLSLDPYVLYWNRNIFQNGAIAEPPKFWDELYALTDALTRKDGALNITQATVGFGEFRNVANAKGVLSLLMHQAGSPITFRTPTGVSNQFLFVPPKSAAVPAEAAVNFFTEFSDPVKSSYTWNRSLPNSKDMFISGDLALYVGPASELYEIQAKNPNLNFDVAHIPQARTSRDKITYADITGLAIVKTSPNVAAAFNFIQLLTSADAAEGVAATLGLPPPRRDLLSRQQVTAAGKVFYESALWSRGWIDPNPRETDRLFAEMIESITAGRARTSEAVSRVSIGIQNLLDTGRGGFVTPNNFR